MGLLDRWAKKKTEEQLAGEVKTETVEKTSSETSAKPKKVSGTKKIASAPKKEVVAKTETPSAQLKGSMYRVIVAPIVSEKAARNEQEGIYTFLVDRSATKLHIRQAIKELYGVNPLRISVQNTEGKRVRFGRGAGRRSDYKKAFVKIPKGSSITVHEGV